MTSPYRPAGALPPPPRQQPEQDKPRKPWWKRWWAWVLIVLVTITLLALLLVVLDKWSIAKLSEMNQEAATRQCEEDVTNKAKYPGGVQFVDPIKVSTEDSVDADVLTYGASGDVDFPNGFGTPVRHLYTCTVLIEGDTGDVRYSFAMAFPKEK